jgi:hypothetical protein
MKSKATPGTNYLIGVMSDTHSLLRQSAIKALEGSDLIIHAGDIGNQETLESLKRIAPVVAVRGNVDHGAWANHLKDSEIIEIGEASFYVLHNLNELDLDPKAAGFNAVISGHSHRPTIENRNDVHFLNPGSAGPRRFNLPITLAQIRCQGDSVQSHLIELEND